MRKARPTRVLLFGSRGRIGSRLNWLLNGAGASPQASRGISYEVWAPDRCAVPLERLEAVQNAVDAFVPNIILNAAAFTNVDAAEQDEATAMRVNADAPAVMAERAKAAGAILVHLSTDYVFDGKRIGPYREDDPTGPINAYGRSKARGEQQIAQVDGIHFICRTAWIYDRQTKNFLTAILNYASRSNQVHVVSEQYGSPSWATSVAQMLAAMLEHMLAADRDWLQTFRGIYHVADDGYVSRADFAREILRLSGASSVEVLDTAAAAFPTLAPRPLRTALLVAKFQAVFGFSPVAWRTALAACLGHGEHPSGKARLPEFGDI